MQAQMTGQTSIRGDDTHDSSQSTGQSTSIKDSLRGLPFAEQEARLSPGRQATGESAILGGGSIGGRTARPPGLEAADAERGYVMPEIDEDALGPKSDYEPFPPLAAPGGASTPPDAIEGYAGIVMGGEPSRFRHAR